MKIAHISDLHLDAVYKQHNLLNTIRLLEYIIDNRYDHVIISGDITENADSSSFELARNVFKKYGLLDHRKLTVTIGNHDIYGGVHFAEDVLNFPAKCKNVKYESKVSEFKAYFNEAFNNAYSHQKQFPFVKEFDDIAIVCLNSIDRYSYIRNPFASNGKIPMSELKRAEKILNDNVPASKKRVIVAHHHFSRDSNDKTASSGSVWQAIERRTMKLRRKKKIIRRFLDMGTELVLHGHLHENTEYRRKGLKFVNAGSSVMGKSDLLALNEINLSGKKISTEFKFMNRNIRTEYLSRLPYISYSFKEFRNPEICMN